MGMGEARGGGEDGCCELAGAFYLNAGFEVPDGHGMWVFHEHFGMLEAAVWVVYIIGVIGLGGLLAPNLTKSTLSLLQILKCAQIF
jgi:hypothetical protein